jgi:hypothetical protein
MRSDMSKVIVERPRLGGKHVRKGRETSDDLQPKNQGMRAPYMKYYQNKELNEYLSPLKRFLHSRVGQPWNAVWSEISANIRSDNAVQQHVRDHVLMWVCRNTRVDDHGEIWCFESRPSLLKGSGQEFYVDPRDGKLCLNNSTRSYSQKWRESKANQEAEWHAHNRTIADGTKISKHQGIWYAIEEKAVPAPSKVTVKGFTGRDRIEWQATPVYDVLLKKTVYKHNGHYVVSKRQLSRTELKRHGVANG